MVYINTPLKIIGKFPPSFPICKKIPLGLAFKLLCMWLRCLRVEVGEERGDSDGTFEPMGKPMFG